VTRHSAIRAVDELIVTPRIVVKIRDAVALNVSSEAVTVRFVPIMAAKKAISICIFTSLGIKKPPAPDGYRGIWAQLCPITFILLKILQLATSQGA